MLSSRLADGIRPERAAVGWAALYGAALQGFWVVTSVYIVVEVGLSPPQLLLLGVALEVSILIAEVPTGVVADTISRKWSLLVSMLIIGASFVLTGLSSSFPPLVVANVLWGVGWTFSSGADVAWLADELAHRGAGRPAIDMALVRKARWQQRGGAGGLVGFGLLGWLTNPATAMIAAGLVLLGLAAWIALLFSERGFTRTPSRRFAESIRILRAGLTLVRGDRTIVRLLFVTLLFNLGAEAMDRLTETRLIALGLPFDVSPVLFFTALGIVGLLSGSALLRRVESQITADDGPRAIYGAMSLLAAVGAMLVAGAPTAMIGAAGVLLARGLAWSVLPVVAAVWANRTTGSEVRATVQSFIGQATSAGQIAGGLLLGAISALFDLSTAIAVSAMLFAASGVLIIGRRPRPSIDQSTNS